MSTPLTPESARPGLGGWLILPVLGFWVTAATSLFSIVARQLPSFFDGTWQRVTDRASPAHHPLWGPVIVLDLLSNVTLFSWFVVLLILIHTNSKHAPRQAILLMAAQIGFAVIKFLLIGLISDDGTNLAKVGGSILRSGVAAAIWMPYFHESRRVKATCTQ